MNVLGTVYTISYQRYWKLLAMADALCNPYQRYWKLLAMADALCNPYLLQTIKNLNLPSSNIWSTKGGPK
jgi:hypothetical protein